MILWVIFALFSGVVEALYFLSLRGKPKGDELIDPHWIFTGIRTVVATTLVVISGAEIKPLLAMLVGFGLLVLAFVQQVKGFINGFARIFVGLFGFFMFLYPLVDMDMWKPAVLLLSYVFVFPFFHDGAIYSTYLTQRRLSFGVKDYLDEFVFGYNHTSTSYIHQLGLLTPMLRLFWLAIGVVAYIISIKYGIVY